MFRPGPALPVILAFFAAALWGVWWIPVRWLRGYGLDGAQGGLLLMSGAALACLAMLAFRPGHARLSGRAWLGAMLIGTAFTAYSAALNYSEVVRVILLFYLAPVWSKIIERLFFGIPWRWTSTLALMAALAGALLLLGTDVFSGSLRGGDVIAILSGAAWSAGAALVFSSPSESPVGLTAVTVAFTMISSLFFILVESAPLPELKTLPALWPAFFVGAAYVIPVLFLTLWSAQRLAPATLSFLLTAELLSGVISGALWLDEPFGWPQAAGAALILSAAMVEVLVPAGDGQLRT